VCTRKVQNFVLLTGFFFFFFFKPKKAESKPSATATQITKGG
jgi:hypothetical protein